MKSKISATVIQILFVFLCVAGNGFALQPPEHSGPMYNKLTKGEHNVMLGKGTEPRFSGKYIEHKAEGIYICRRCNASLFDSTHKFVNYCGWPCFDDAMKDAVKRSVNGAKIEIQCTNCGGHLGHQFLREDFTPKNVRNCVNSVSLTFVAKGKELPGVISSEPKGIPKKPDANKPDAIKNGEKASDTLPKVENQDSTPKPSFEFLRNKLLLQRHDGRLVHDDFYGQGGEMRIVGDRAALALVRQKEFDTLFGQLGNTDAKVRLRVVRALEACGDEAVIQRLREATRLREAVRD